MRPLLTVCGMSVCVCVSFCCIFMWLREQVTWLSVSIWSVCKVCAQYLCVWVYVCVLACLCTESIWEEVRNVSLNTVCLFDRLCVCVCVCIDEWCLVSKERKMCNRGRGWKLQLNIYHLSSHFSLFSISLKFHQVSHIPSTSRYLAFSSNPKKLQQLSDKLHWPKLSNNSSKNNLYRCLMICCLYG